MPHPSTITVRTVGSKLPVLPVLPVLAPKSEKVKEMESWLLKTHQQELRARMLAFTRPPPDPLAVNRMVLAGVMERWQAETMLTALSGDDVSVRERLFGSSRLTTV